MLLKKYDNPNTKTFEDAIHASSYYGSDNFVDIITKIKKIVDYEGMYTKGYKPSPEQYRSILTQADRILIDACPGSGKTTSMIFKIMIDTAVNDFKYGDQLVLTYTNKAAEDMKKKYSKLCARHNIQPAADMYTIHSFAYNVQSNILGLDILTDTGKTIEIITDKVKEKEEKQELDINSKYKNMVAFLDEDEDEDEYSNNQVEYKYVTETSIYLEVLKDLGMSRVYYSNINQLPQWINTIIEANIKTNEQLRSIEQFSELKEVTIEDLYSIEKASREKRLSYGLINFTDMLVLLYKRLSESKTFDDLGPIKDALRIKYLYIDEVQDISELQWKIFMEILRLNPECKLLCVGDTDQSIFSFRGSSPKFITNFEELLNKESFNDNKTVDIISYTINRRSSKSIIDISSTFIHNNINRRQKEMIPINNPEGLIDILVIDDKDASISDIINKIKAMQIENGEDYLNNVAVLYREHKQGMSLTRKLIRNGIPVKFPGNIGINMPECDDIIGIFDMINNPCNADLAEKYLYKTLTGVNKDRSGKISNKIRESNKPFSYYIYKSATTKQELNNLREAYSCLQNGRIIKATEIVSNLYLKAFLNLFPEKIWKIEEIKDIMSEYEGLNYFEMKEQIYKDKLGMKSLANNNIGVSLLTFHASKGLEFDNVFIMPISDAICPKMKIAETMSETNKVNYIEEERRLLYVALTRAIKNLTVYLKDVNSKFTKEIRNAQISSTINWGV